MHWEEIIFACVTLAVPFVAGMFLFSKWIFRDVEVRWGVGFASQVAFSCTLAVAFQTHTAVLGEVSGVLSRQSRALLWAWDFTCWIILLKVVIPFLMLCAFFGKRRQYSLTLRVFLTLVSEGVWLFLLSWGQNGTSLNLEKETERLGMIGLASVAILSGWGAVHGPYSYGPWFIKQYDDAEISRVEQKLWSVMEMRSSLKRRECILTIQLRSNCTAGNGGDGSMSTVRFLKQLWRGSETILRRDGGQQQSTPVGNTLANENVEAESLSLLSTELFLELTEMKRAKQANLFRTTMLGRVYTFLGYTFAAYCVLKMITACYGMMFPKKAEDPDLITNVLSFVLLLARDRAEANALAQTISFVMVGVLVFNSFRGLLVTLGRIFHQMGPRDSSFVALLLTEIMGQYLLSSIILLDMNVPHKYRGDLFFRKFEFFRVWFDALFLLAGLVSLILLYALDRAQGSRTEFYHTTVHEKLI